MNKPIQMPDKLSVKIRAQDKEAIYHGTGGVGDKATDYKQLREFTDFKLLKADVDYIKKYFKRIESITIDFAELTGLEHKGHLASVLASLLQKFTVLYPGKKYTGITRDLEGYFAQLNEFDLVVPSEQVKDVDPNLLPYYEWVDGKAVFDQEKYDRENLI